MNPIFSNGGVLSFVQENIPISVPNPQGRQMNLQSETVLCTLVGSAADQVLLESYRVRMQRGSLRQWSLSGLNSQAIRE
jgi:hypothetical protein